MKWKVLAAICAALLGAGIANSDTKPTKTVTRTVTVHVKSPTKVKVITKTKITPVRPADGYITLADCKGLTKHTEMRDFIARYGWPAHPASDLGRLYYPLVENHHQLCAVTPDQGQIYDVGIHDDLDTL